MNLAKRNLRVTLMGIVPAVAVWWLCGRTEVSLTAMKRLRTRKRVSRFTRQPQCKDDTTKSAGIGEAMNLLEAESTQATIPSAVVQNCPAGGPPLGHKR
jgi:hypothetical protein